MLYDLIKVQHAYGKRRNSHLKKKNVLFLITCNKKKKFQMRVTSHTCTVYYRKKLLN